MDWIWFTKVIIRALYREGIQLFHFQVINSQFLNGQLGLVSQRKERYARGSSQVPQTRISGILLLKTGFS